MLFRLIAALIVGIILVCFIFPDAIKSILNVENFTGIPDAGFNRRGAFPGRNILSKVGKDPLPRQPTYTDDPRMGNARRDLSKLPSTEGSGFSLPRAYSNYRTPNYQDGYDVAVMDAPRASETYHSPRSDAFHLYYRNLHDTLDA